MNVDPADLDRLMADASPKVIASEGFTQSDMMARYGWSATTAYRRIQALIVSGDIEEAGIRPGKGQRKVYKLVAPAAQGS